VVLFVLTIRSSDADSSEFRQGNEPFSDYPSISQSPAARFLLQQGMDDRDGMWYSTPPKSMARKGIPRKVVAHPVTHHLTGVAVCRRQTSEIVPETPQAYISSSDDIEIVQDCRSFEPASPRDSWSPPSPSLMYVEQKRKQYKSGFSLGQETRAQSLANTLKGMQQCDSDIPDPVFRNEHKRQLSQQKSSMNPRLMKPEQKTVGGGKRMAQFTQLFTFSG
jgi:hypothetical protein